MSSGRRRSARGQERENVAKPSTLEVGEAVAELPYGLEASKLAPSALEGIDKSSLPADEMLGGRKKVKNKFQEHVEETAAKREQREREERAEMDKLIQKIKQEDGPSSTSLAFAPQAFVRGGIEGAAAPPTTSDGDGLGKAGLGAQVYTPAPLFAAKKVRDEEEEAAASSSGGKRAIDEIKEEIQ